MKQYHTYLSTKNRGAMSGQSGSSDKHTNGCSQDQSIPRLQESQSWKLVPDLISESGRQPRLRTPHCSLMTGWHCESGVLVSK
jgi:hypothetical protein